MLLLMCIMVLFDLTNINVSLLFEQKKAIIMKSIDNSYQRETCEVNFINDTVL